MVKRRGLVLALVISLLVHSSAQPRADESPASLAQLQVRVTTSSDWTSVQLEHLDVRSRHSTAETSTEAVWNRVDGWTVVKDDTADETMLVVDLVVELGSTEDPVIVVAKGRKGLARVEVMSANGTEPQRATEIVVDTQDPSTNVVRERIDREVLLNGELAVREVDDRNLSMAFYYPWFRADASEDRKVNPDKPGSWYATDDRDHVRGMVAEAAGAGLDGFLVSWEGELHANVVDRLIDEVEQQPGFVVAPILELRRMRTAPTLLGDRFDPDVATEALASFLGRVPTGSLLHVGDRPVVVVFGMWDLDQRAWERFRSMTAHLDPFIIGDRLDPQFPIDGFYHYDPNPRSIDELESTYAAAIDRTRLEPAVNPSRRQLLWAATVSPGFDNRSSNLVFGRRSTDRADGWRYDETWRVALASQPEWVFVTSWNEWYEQTHISPGRSSGSAALEQTTAWTDRFRSSAG